MFLLKIADIAPPPLNAQLCRGRYVAAVVSGAVVSEYFYEYKYEYMGAVSRVRLHTQGCTYGTYVSNSHRVCVWYSCNLSLKKSVFNAGGETRFEGNVLIAEREEKRRDDPLERNVPTLKGNLFNFA